MQRKLKIMLDTNAFDYIYDNQLVDFVNSYVDKGEIELYKTHIQNDEIEKIKVHSKKEQIKKIQCTQIPTSSGIFGTKTERGFEGSRIGEFRIPSEEIADKIKKAQSTVSPTHPLGNSADILIVNTATEEKMDYLVSNDKDDFPKIAQQLESQIKIIPCEEFHSLLKQLGN